MFNLRKLAVCALALSAYPAAYAGQSTHFTNEMIEQLASDVMSPVVNQKSTRSWGKKVGITTGALATSALVLASACLLAKHLRRDAAPVLTEEQQLDALRREAFVNTLRAGYWPWGAMRPDPLHDWMVCLRIHQYLTDVQPALLAFHDNLHEEDSAGNKVSYRMCQGNINEWVRSGSYVVSEQRNHPSAGTIFLSAKDDLNKPSLYVEAGLELDNRTDLHTVLDPSTHYMTIENKEKAYYPLLFVGEPPFYKEHSEKDKKMAEDILRGQKTPEEIYDTYKPIPFYGTKEGLLAYEPALRKCQK
jgi:hypothetical protein